MTNSKAATPSVHTITFDISTDPDRGASVLVDGSPLELQARAGFLGFSPGELFSARLPLLPAHPPRHVPIALCSCGVGGCATIAPVIAYDGDDQELVVWRDFRDLGWAASSPSEVDPDVDLDTRSEYRQDPLAFDRVQYEGAVLTASADREWETPGEATARLLHGLLGTDAAALRSLGFVLSWVAPSRRRTRTWTVSLEVPRPDRTLAQLRADAMRDRLGRPQSDGRRWTTLRSTPLRLRPWEHEPRQLLLELSTSAARPVDQAADLFRQLTDVPLPDWERTFPRRSHHER